MQFCLMRDINLFCLTFQMKGVAGTVESLIESELLVDYKEKEKKLWLNITALQPGRSGCGRPES